MITLLTFTLTYTPACGLVCHYGTKGITVSQERLGGGDGSGGGRGRWCLHRTRYDNPPIIFQQ